MSSVYVVSSEIGRWSYVTAECDGVFSTFEKAESWVRAQSIPTYLYHKTMERDGWTKSDDIWSVEVLKDRPDEYEKVTYELLRTETLAPSTTDGKTYEYNKSLIGRDAWVKTFYIVEMQLDPEVEVSDGQ